MKEFAKNLINHEAKKITRFISVYFIVVSLFFFIFGVIIGMNIHRLIKCKYGEYCFYGPFGKSNCEFDITLDTYIPCVK